MSKTLLDLIAMGDKARVTDLSQLDMSNWTIIEHFPIGEPTTFGVISRAGKQFYGKLSIVWMTGLCIRTISLDPHIWGLEINENVVSIKRFREDEPTDYSPPKYVLAYTIFNPATLVVEPE